MDFSNIQPVGAGNKDPSRPFSAGEKVTAEVSSKNGNEYTVRIKGAEYSARIAGGEPDGKFRAEVIKTSPQLELRLLTESAKTEGAIRLSGRSGLPLGSSVEVTVVRSEKGVYMLRIGGLDFTAKVPGGIAGNAFTARVVSVEPLEIMPDKGSILLRGDVRGMLLQAATRPPSVLAADMGTQTLALNSGALRQLIRDGGLFFENKLSRSQSVTGDNKYNALVAANQQQWDGVTRMQLTALLIEDGLFSFFELDETEEENTIRISKDRWGMSMYMKLNFTRLGETVIGVTPSNTGVYNVTVRTKNDISELLSTVNIKGANLRWAKLKNSDLEKFDIKREVLARIGRFDIIA